MLKKRYSLLFSVLLSILLLVLIGVTVLWKMDFFKDVVSISGYPVYYSFDEMVEKSCLIVRGKITEQSDAIRIRPTNGGEESLFTDHYLEISYVLRGEAEVGDTVAVRTQGGETNTLIVENDGYPKIKVGDEVIAFLYRHNVGGGYTTDEDYYRIIADDQGWYVLDEAKTVFNSAAGQEALTWEQCQVEIPELSKQYPIDYNWKRDEVRQGIERDLNNASITQEEYEQEIASMDVYATVIN